MHFVLFQWVVRLLVRQQQLFNVIVQLAVTHFLLQLFDGLTLLGCKLLTHWDDLGIFAQQQLFQIL